MSLCYKLLERLALQRISPTVQTRLVSGKVEAVVTRLLLSPPAEPKDWRRLFGLNSSI